MSTPKHAPPETEQVEAIVTCACSHTLSEHAEDGCVVEECDCTIERNLLAVGKLQAIDQVQ